MTDDPKAIARDLPKAQRAAVIWFHQHGRTALFPADAPTRVVRDRLIARGLLRTDGAEPVRFGFMYYTLTEFGQAVAASCEEKR